MKVSSGLALFAGLVSFFSPCVLPMIPAYFSYLAGNITGTGKGKIIIRALGFVVGFSIIFIIMGASASAIGRLLLSRQQLFTKVSGIIIIIFGLHLMEVLRFIPLMKERRFNLKMPVINNPFAAIPLGMAFAAGWTPCIGPVLGTILLYAGSLGTMKAGIILLSFYSLGLALPFLLVGFVLEKFQYLLGRIGKYSLWVSRISGFIMLIFGLLIFFDKLAILSSFLPETFSL